MNRNERGLEFKVGLFVFIGLSILGALAIQFGRLGEGFKSHYPITVRFSDASGLLKGSSVLLAGAKIGRVSDGPHLVSEGQGVAVPLRIYGFVKIPAGSKFMVGSSGLLGDRFVTVFAPPGKPTAYIEKNAFIDGTRETGMDDLTREGGKLVEDLRTAVQNVNAAVTRLNETALSSGSMENLKASFEHLNEATGSLAQSSKKFDDVIEKADATMGSAKKAADDLQGAMVDARKLFKSATEGKGLLGTLVTNQELSNDLKALITNLRAHGVLFYRDSAAKIDMKKREEPKPTRQTGGRQ
jgi:phospholipid/cholesterol/gamma-HCH transport system substrate-binding protein